MIFIFAQNIYCGYTLDEAVLTSTNNLCFGAKIRKIGILLHTPVFMPPTLKKLEGHIGLGLSVCLCVRV